MVECPNRLWSGYSWSHLQVIYGTDSLEPWLWNADLNTLVPVSSTSIPTTAVGADYSFGTFQGKFTMFLALNSDYRYGIFGTGVHEAFHQLGQKSWARDRFGKSRATDYPLLWEPRYLRRQILSHLQQAIYTNSADEIRRAKFFYNKWAAGFPDEVKSVTDGYEGTPRYMEVLATGLAKVGCKASDEELRNSIVPLIQEFGSSIPGDLPHEGYEVGSVAAFASRFVKGDNGWQPAAITGVTPLEYLMGNVDELSASDDQALVDQFKTNVAYQNAEYGKFINKDIASFADTSFVRVGLSWNELQGNLQVSNFLNATAIGVQMMPLIADHHFKSATTTTDIKIVRGENLILGSSGPCTKSNFVLLVPASAINGTSPSALLSSSGASGALSGTWAEDSSHFRYFCTQ